MENIFERVAKLPPEKRAQLELQLEQYHKARGQEQGVPAIQPRESCDPVLLSFSQERLWLFEQIEPGTTAYNLSYFLQIKGAVTIWHLEESLRAIVIRHHVLRIGCGWRDEDAVQYVRPCPDQVLFLNDLSAVSKEARQKELQRLIDKEAQTPFDVQNDWLFRFRLVRLDVEEYVFLATFHHIVFDGWSLGIFFQELSAHYTALECGSTVSLPALPVQYTDFAYWQRNQRGDDTFAGLSSYWQRQLAGMPTILNLPTDFPRPVAQSYRGRRSHFVLPATLTSELHVLSQQADATLFMVLLAAFEVLLHRYSGQNDIAVGTPIANRRPETEQLIGFFVNTLVLRGTLDNDPRFDAFLRQIRETCLDAYSHQEMPFEQLVKMLQVERNLSYSPLFQVMFSFQNAPTPALELANLIFAPLILEETTWTASRFDLTLLCWEERGHLHGSFEYATDLFETATIEAMARNLQTLLEGIVADPGQHLSELPLVSAEERHALIVQKNATQVTFEHERCIHTLFELQVERTADAIALVFEDTCLTYGALDQKANQLAQYLRRLGIGPDVCVGICVERSLEMVIGLLAILKAGGAYVPLDPDYPQERLAHMIAASHITVLLTQHTVAISELASTLPTIFLDTDWQVIAQEREAPPCSPVTPENLAYVIFTSGSTGVAKGVMVPHRAVSNFFTGMDQCIKYETPGTWLAVTSIAFDISVVEIFWTLTRGFQVVIQTFEQGMPVLKATQKDGTTKPPEFSLFYFANNAQGSTPGDSYRLLLEGARFADQHGFHAIWTPERHFHAFGGLYPNPSVTSAAIAAVTERIKIRAGSVVLPLHNPIRVVEEWSVVDNISRGRVGISFAPGWHANDFALAPENFAERKTVMAQKIATVRRLWRGESITVRNGTDHEIAVSVFPRPTQRELPLWLTSSGSAETFRVAGEQGMGLLTHLLGQDLDKLAEKIALYRDAWRQHGHQPGDGHVTLMLHAFIGENSAAVREKVRQPFIDYLQSSIGLAQTLMQRMGVDQDLETLSENDVAALLNHAFERYYEGSSLIGTLHSCQSMLRRLEEIGVDELACLIDFGIDDETVLHSLHHLNRLRLLSRRHEKKSSVIQHIQQRGVTHLQCTPSLMSLLMQEPEAPAALGSLHELLLGGEALPITLVNQLKACVTGTIHNMYGPTETTIWSTSCVVHATTAQQISLGAPLANTQIYVVDKRMHLQPGGVPGELLIGGAGVTRGYIGSPELSAERCVPDPFTDQPGARVYRTGDLVRYRIDGTLEFLGRSDYQTKIRGMRIELQEIEAALVQHPLVREAVVIARGHVSTEKQLVAYIVLHKQADALSTADFRTFLRQKLPEHMLPVAFIVLESLPLTLNGKVDREKLPELSTLPATSVEKYVAPVTPQELQMAAIWQAVLGVEHIGIHDNFFELGGDSWRAVYMKNLAQNAGLQFSIQQLFQHSTIAELLIALQPGERTAEKVSLQPFQLLSPGDRAHLPETVEDAYPMTQLQLGMIFHSQAQPEAALYHDVSSLSIQAPCDAQIFYQALQQIVQRHAVLRTIFDLSSYSKPLQLVHKDIAAPFHVDDIRHLPSEQQDAAIDAWMKEEGLKPFDFTRMPLFRLQVHQRDTTTLQLTICYHHAILDGWSIASVVSELLQTYTALVEGEPSPVLPSLSSSFRDAVYQEQLALQQPEQKDYWMRQLEHYTVATLPSWPAGTNAGAGAFPEMQISFSLDVTKGLKNAARMALAPLKSALLAAHVRIVGALSAQADVLTGLVSNIRSEADTTGQVPGLFLTTLPFRLNLVGGSWIQLVQQVFEVERDIWPYRHYPLAEIQKHMGGQSLFETCFVYDQRNIHTTQSSMHAPVQSSLFLERTHFALTASFVHNQDDETIRLTLRHDPSRLSALQVAEIAACYTSVITALAKNPSAHYEQRSVLSESALQRTLEEWNSSTRQIPLQQRFYELFEEQMRRSPEAVALVHNEQMLTYDALNRRANQLAHMLRLRGVRPEQCIGIYMKRSLEMVLALLAVSKAGGTYLPLDPTYPDERIAFLLRDANIKLVLTRSQEAATLPVQSTQVLSIDVAWPQIITYSDENLPVHTSADHIAYVIYTSGSTGTPKGVMIPHKAMTNILIAMRYQLDLDERSIFFAVTSMSFDMAVLELFLPLLLGARLLVTTEDTLSDGRRLRTALEQYGATAMQATPITWRLLLDTGTPPALLRTILCGGEALPAQLAHDLAKNAVELWNLYGPTETTVYSAGYKLGEINSSTVPIGRPVANTQLYVLDTHLIPVPVGVMGELYISGAGLARGYLQRPDLTAERFIPHPFSSQPGALMYRTGDYVRYLPDGAIDFVERTDKQIKLRGFRIELGEIEAQLKQYEAVQEAVVTVWGERAEEKRLIAYVVWKKAGQYLYADARSERDAVAALRDYLRTRLPEYMVPATFVPLEQMPRTPNGKLDTRALPQPSQERSLLHGTDIAPRFPLEEQLVRIWSRILEVDQIGVQDDFFELGGNSIVAVRLMAAIQQQLNIHLSPQLLFHHRTVEQLAQALSSTPPSEPLPEPSALVAIKPFVPKPLFFVHPIGGHVFCYEPLARSFGDAYPFYGLQARGFDGSASPYDRIEDMAAYYIREIKRLQPEGPYAIGGWCMGGTVAYEMAHQLHAQGEATVLVALVSADADYPVDVELVDDPTTSLIHALKLLRLAVNVEEIRKLLHEGISDPLEMLQTHHLLSYEVDPALVYRHMAIYQAHAKALSTYQPQPYPLNVTVFTPTEQVAASHDLSYVTGRPSLGWDKFVQGKLQVIPTQGNHYSMMAYPNVQKLATALKEAIARAYELPGS